MQGSLVRVSNNTLLAQKIKGQTTSDIKLSSYDCSGNDVQKPSSPFFKGMDALPSREECRERCKATAGCLFYTYNSGSGMCYPKSKCSSFLSTSLGSSGGSWQMAAASYEDLKVYSLTADGTLLYPGEEVKVTTAASSSVPGEEAIESGTGVNLVPTDDGLGTRAVVCFSNPTEDYALQCTNLILTDAIVSALPVKVITQHANAIIHTDSSALGHSRNLHTEYLSPGATVVCYRSWGSDSAISDHQCSIVTSLPDISLYTVPFMELDDFVCRTCDSSSGPCSPDGCVPHRQLTWTAPRNVAQYSQVSSETSSQNMYCNQLDNVSWTFSSGYADTNGAWSADHCMKRCTQDHKCVAVSYFTPKDHHAAPAISGAENYRCYLFSTCEVKTDAPASLNWTAQTWSKFAPVDFWREPGAMECKPLPTHVTSGDSSVQLCADRCRKDSCLAFTYVNDKCYVATSGQCPESTISGSQGVIYLRLVLSLIPLFIT